jgi:hypothetical protein
MIGAAVRRPSVEIHRPTPGPKVRVARLEPSPIALVSPALALLLSGAGGRAPTWRSPRLVPPRVGPAMRPGSVGRRQAAEEHGPGRDRLARSVRPIATASEVIDLGAATALVAREAGRLPEGRAARSLF